MEAYLRLARGVYQRGILTGRYAMSGADLRGRAKNYAGRYAESRRNLLARLSRHGLPYRVRVGAHGKITLELGPAHAVTA